MAAITAPAAVIARPRRSPARRPHRSRSQPTTGANAYIPAMCPLITHGVSPPWPRCCSAFGVTPITPTIAISETATATSAPRNAGTRNSSAFDPGRRRHAPEVLLLVREIARVGTHRHHDRRGGERAGDRQRPRHDVRVTAAALGRVLDDGDEQGSADRADDADRDQDADRAPPRSPAGTCRRPHRAPAPRRPCRSRTRRWRRAAPGTTRRRSRRPRPRPRRPSSGSRRAARAPPHAVHPPADHGGAARARRERGRPRRSPRTSRAR